MPGKYNGMVTRAMARDADSAAKRVQTTARYVSSSAAASGAPAAASASFTVPCSPCMLRAAQASSSSEPSLAVKAVLNDYKRYREKHSLLPETGDEWVAFNAGKFADTKNINKTPPKVGENKYPIRPIWFKNPNAQKSYQVITTLFQGLGIAEMYMPGADTPVCDGTHFASLFKPGILTGLKAAGVDVIIIVVPDSIDVARAWGERKLAEAALSHLMPEDLKELDLNQRLEQHPTMPRIIMMGERTIARMNEMALVKGDAPRLGLAAERAYTLYDRKGTLKHLEKAPDAGLEACKLHMTGDKMLAMAQGINLRLDPTFSAPSRARP